MSDWDFSRRVCANCKHWDTEQQSFDQYDFAPRGKGGHHCNGTASECRRNPPVAGDPKSFQSAVWPTTGREDYCGEFERRVRNPRNSGVAVKLKAPVHWWSWPA